MEKQVTRRAFLRAAGLAACASALTGCAPKVIEKVVKETQVVKETVVAKETVVMEAPTPKGKVIFWSHDQHPLDLAAEGFVQKYPEVEFEAPHPAEWGSLIPAAMAAGTGCPDLIWIEANEVQEYGCSELLFPTTPELEPVKDQYHPAKLGETFVAKVGEYCGWPGDLSPSGYFYRQEKYAELGYGDVDWENLSWDDFVAMSADIASKGKYTFTFPADWGGPLFEYVIQQYGGLVVSQDGLQIMVDDEKGVQAMSLVKAVYDTGAGMDVPWMGPGYWAAIQEDTLIGDFGSAWYKGFYESQMKTPEQGAGDWRIAKLPKGPGIKYRTALWGGATLATPQCGENKENALLFMKYALGSLEGCALAGQGIIPAYRPYLASSLFRNARSAVFGDWAFNEFWAGQEQELSTEYIRPAGYQQVLNASYNEIATIMRGELSVEDGLKRIVELATPDFERVICRE